MLFSMWMRDASRPPEIGENLQRVEWLPEEATSITFYKSYGYTAYEFKISEEGFLKWAENVVYESDDAASYQAITDVSNLVDGNQGFVRRYNFATEREAAKLKEIDYETYLQNTSVVITNGLWGSMRRGSAGGYEIGYDRITGTAYFQRNPR